MLIIFMSGRAQSRPNQFYGLYFEWVAFLHSDRI